jgi:hypothetical protein
MAVLALLPAVITAVLWAILGGFGSLVLVVLVQMSIMGIAVAGMLFLLNLPFMILVFNSPLYGERFRALFCAGRLATGQVADAGIPGSLDTTIRGPEIANAPHDTSQR